MVKLIILLKGALIKVSEHKRVFYSAGMSFLSIQCILIWYIYTSLKESEVLDQQEDFYRVKEEILEIRRKEFEINE